jgi:transglutaminase-like putative cysteine protease
MNLGLRFFAELSAPNSAPAVLMVEADASNDIVETGIDWTPRTASDTFVDVFGNGCRRMLLPAGDVQIEYTAIVSTPDEVLDVPGGSDDGDILSVPPDVLLYTLPSRYCPSDRFELLATELFGNGRPVRERVQDIAGWINEHVQYAYGTSNVSTSAFETVTERVGVCRDFAHLGITFCRTLHIPARYVSGYCLDLEPQDLHAYFEAFVDGRWTAFDATSATPRRALVKIASGLDAATCAWCTLYGSAVTNSVSVSVAELRDADLLPVAA